MKIRLLIGLLCLSIYGCGGLETNAHVVDWRYGNFCGKGYPDIKAKSISDEIAQLRRISPRDDIDAACQAHDICYAKFSGKNKDCDAALAGNIRAMDFGNDPRGRCLRIATEVGKFALLNPSGDIVDTLIALIYAKFAGVAEAYSTMSMGVYDKFSDQEKGILKCKSRRQYKLMQPGDQEFQKIIMRQKCLEKLSGSGLPEYWAAVARCNSL